MNHRKFAPGRTDRERKNSQVSALRGIREQQPKADKEDSCSKEQPKSFFPIFVNLDGKRATIVGGGDVASRRAKTLIKFGASVRFVGPDIANEAAGLVRDGKATWLSSEFAPPLLDGSDIVIAAADNREVNRAVGKAAKQMQILVNVADSREESTYMFPKVAQNDKFVAGFIMNGSDYDAVIKMMQRLLEKIKNGKI